MSHKDLWVKIKRETKGRSPAEELAVLRGYLADWPQYKGPYQELGKKLTRRAEELERVLSVRSSHEAHRDPFSVRRRGLAEVVIIGLPNVGKSTLFTALTGTAAETADYPYTTLVPNIGMMTIGAYEFELVDLPPAPETELSSVSYAGGLREAVTNAGLLAVVVDCSGDPERQLRLTAERLTELDVKAVWDVDGAWGLGEGGRERPSILFGSRVDAAPAGALSALRELAPGATVFGHPLGADGRSAAGTALCELVGRIVVVARNPAEPDDPIEYAVPRGSTIMDLAAAIHKDLAAHAKRARVWGASTAHDGSEVGLEHELAAGDVVEILER
jgi:ribosome-interacting GTPase 1